MLPKVAAGQINAMVVVAHPDHVIQPYHTTLIAWGILLIAMVFNTSLFRKLPTLEGVVMVLHVLGFFAFIIVLWFVCHFPAYPAHRRLTQRRFVGSALLVAM